MDKEIIFDKILRKFEGDRTFNWDYIHQKEFYESIDSDYFVVENHINFLIGDNALNEDPNTHNLSLSRKGWFIMTNSETDGYAAKNKKENKKSAWTIILGIVSIGTFILVIIRFSNDFFIVKKKSKSNNDTIIIDSTTKLKTQMQQLPSDTTPKNKKNKSDTGKVTKP